MPNHVQSEPTSTKQPVNKGLRGLSSKEYGDNCKKLITSLGLHQTDIAKRLNLTSDAFWRRLDGSRGRWDMEWLTRLAIAMDIDIGYLARYLAGVNDD